MPPRFFVTSPLPAEGEYVLPANVAHHAKQVLRLNVGDKLVLFDGRGGESCALVMALQDSVRVQLEAYSAIDRESPLKIELAQALATGDKMDWIVQKAVELGANAFWPVMSERCVVKLDSERAAKRVAHWQQIAIAASEQCGRNTIMQIQPVIRLTTLLAQSYNGEAFTLNPASTERLATTAPAQNLRLYIGPEGGFSGNELDAMSRARCRDIRLGPRVLRTETAGLAAITMLQTLWGDFLT